MAHVEFLFQSKGGNNLYVYVCARTVFTTGIAECLTLGFFSLYSPCEAANLGCEAEIKTQALMPPICKHPI